MLGFSETLAIGSLRAEDEPDKKQGTLLARPETPPRDKKSPYCSRPALYRFDDLGGLRGVERRRNAEVRPHPKP